MLRKGRIVNDARAQLARPIVPQLAVDSPQQLPAWINAVAPANVRDAFAPFNPQQAQAPQAAPQVDYEAQQRAMMAALEQERQALKAQQAKYIEAVNRLNQQAQQRAASPERVLDLVLLIAREVIGHEASADPEMVLNAVEQGIAALGGDEPIDVRMTQADAQLLTELKPELAEAVRLTIDESVGPGGVVVENSRRIIDASLNERLEAVRGALADALIGGNASRRVA